MDRKALDLQGFLLCLPQIFQRYFLYSYVKEDKEFSLLTKVILFSKIVDAMSR